jgi:hypothetical protein
MSKGELPRENPDELKQVQESLAALAPRPMQVDRDRLMFLAGAAAAQGSGFRVQGSEAAALETRLRPAWLWPAATGLLGATSLALAIALVVRTGSPPQIVYIDRPVPAMLPMGPGAVTGTSPTDDSPAAATADEPRSAPRIAAELAPSRVSAPQVPADNYLRSREVALRMGIDALGSPRLGGGSASAMTYLDWLAEQSDGLSPPASSLESLPQM